MYNINIVVMNNGIGITVHINTCSVAGDGVAEQPWLIVPCRPGNFYPVIGRMSDDTGIDDRERRVDTDIAIRAVPAVFDDRMFKHTAGVPALEINSVPQTRGWCFIGRGKDDRRL